MPSTSRTQRVTSKRAARGASPPPAAGPKLGVAGHRGDGVGQGVGCSGGTTSASSPSVQRFGISPTAVATTGTPMAAASIRTTGSPSWREGSTKRSAAASRRKNVGALRRRSGSGRPGPSRRRCASSSSAERPPAHGHESAPARRARPTIRRGLQQDVVALLTPKIGHRQRQQLVVGQPELLAHLAARRLRWRHGPAAPAPSLCRGSRPWRGDESHGGSDSLAACDTMRGGRPARWWLG